MKSKTTFVFKTVALAALAALSSASAFAAPQALARGELRLEPKVMHQAPVTGQLELQYEGGTFKQVVVKLDKPIFGSKEYHSATQWLNRVEAGGKPQLGLAYQLSGPPHGWFFVLVASSAEGNLYDGLIYRVSASLRNIQNALEHGVTWAADGSPAVPATWKRIGSATLKY
jgi:hypothetical protein